MKVSYRMEGAGTLSRGLRALARDDELDTVKLAALEDAGQPIRDAVKLEAPFDEGRLYSAIEMEVDQPWPRRIPTRTGVAIWVKYTKDYRLLAKYRGQNPRKAAIATGRGYQRGSIPSVYGAFLNFLARFASSNDWMQRGWDAAGGGRAATDRVSRSLKRSLIALVTRRLSER